jgi:hypothetical protein
LLDARYAAQQGAFARSTWTQQGHDFVANAHCEVREQRLAFVGHTKIDDFKSIHH